MMSLLRHRRLASKPLMAKLGLYYVPLETRTRHHVIFDGATGRQRRPVMIAMVNSLPPQAPGPTLAPVFLGSRTLNAAPSKARAGAVARVSGPKAAFPQLTARA